MAAALKNVSFSADSIRLRLSASSLLSPDAARRAQLSLRSKARWTTPPRRFPVFFFILPSWSAAHPPLIRLQRGSAAVRPSQSGPSLSSACGCPSTAIPIC